MRLPLSFALLAAVLLGSGPAPAESGGLLVRGKGKEQVLVAEQFTGETRQAYALFSQRCTKCHEMARPIAALQTGITPISGGRFDDDGIKKYVVKMMRKPKSGISKADARTLILFLRVARQQAETRPAK